MTGSGTMPADVQSEGRSFGRRLMLMVAAHATGVALAMMALLVGHAYMEGARDEATRAFLEEQRIAEGLTTAVMRQLAAATAYQASPDQTLLTEFRESGEEAALFVREYLFRPLTLEQRLELESVKEAHQRLEVAAARVLEMTRRGQGGETAEASAAMAAYGLALQDATSRFLDMRNETLEALRERSAASLRLVYVGGGLFALLTVLGAILWGGFLQRRLARPLEDLAGAAGRIREGDLSAQVPVPEDRELAAVASSFNDMARSLREARAAENRRAEELREALDQLHDTQAELVQTEKLSALGRMMAGLAHELNNPLASVLGYGQLLDKRVREAGPISASEIRNEFVDPIVTEASRARDLVRNLLRFTRKSAGPRGATRLSEAIAVVARLRSYGFEQLGLGLEIEPVPEDLWVAGDAQRLQQVLMNLVENAYDAMSEEAQDGGDGRHPTVRVRAERRADLVDVIIEDEGPGFPDPDRAFEPFYTTKPVGQGTGLGLTLVHGFMEEFGGQVRAENRETGGARIVLTFRGAGPQEETADVLPSSEEVEAEWARALRVLVVEDEAPLRGLQQRLLARLGATVELAGGGQEARAMLERIDVDIVVTDVKMPDGSGLELYDWAVSERPELADRFLFVTGDVGDEAIVDLSRRMPDRFLSKPFHADEYTRRVAGLIRELGADGEA